MIERIFYPSDGNAFTAFTEGKEGYHKIPRIFHGQCAGAPEGRPILSVEKPDCFLLVHPIGHGLKVRQGMIEPSPEPPEYEKLLKAELYSVFQTDEGIGVVFLRGDAGDAAAAVQA